MSIKSRINRLEREGEERCPECRGKTQKIHVYYPDKGDPIPEPEHCPGCGRSLSVVIEVVYKDREGGGG